MSTAKDRVIEELAQLDERIQKLTIFLKGPSCITLTDAAIERLHQQCNIMLAYKTLLKQRLDKDFK